MEANRVLEPLRKSEAESGSRSGPSDTDAVTDFDSDFRKWDQRI